MIKLRILILCIPLFIAIHGFGQDVHYSQFDYNPIFQNPGNSGHFNGDFRFHFNHKDQWRRVTVPFQTTQLSVDARIKKIPNLAIGLYFMHDVVGDGNLRTFEIMPSVSYQFKLSSDTTHTIRPGIQIGFNSRQLDFNQFYFDNQFNGVFFDPSLPSNETLGNQRKSNVNIGAGLVYEYFVNSRYKITSGVGLFNINKPNQAFLGDKVRRDVRANFYVRGQKDIGLDWDIIPSLQLNKQGSYTEFIIGGQAKYYLENRNGSYKALYGGLFLRNKDAFYLLLGMDWQNMWAGISYDINVSQLVPASNARGGLELSFRYILTRFKPKQIKHRICPDFI